MRSFILRMFMVGWTMLSSGVSYAQQERLKFHRISLEQELSHGTVYSILQDRRGFLWVATEGGLNRYDGYSITTFLHDPLDSNSIANSNVSSILEDRYGFLWLATWGGGLDRYDPATGKFHHYQHRPQNPASISDDRVQTLFEDSKGNIWIGTYSGGLNRFNIERETFTVLDTIRRILHRSATTGCGLLPKTLPRICGSAPAMASANSYLRRPK